VQNDVEFMGWRSQYASEIVGDSPAILAALDTVYRVAATDCNILITGETGTGKELFARASHRTSPRRGRPFIPANGGTIFLDEIGDLPLSAQAKLLRVLEERVVTPVGSDIDIPVDVRVIAATHRNLEEMVAQGKFRADLYFRLAVVPLHLPSLRERGDDIDLIADMCVAKSLARLGRTSQGLDASARAAMRSYAWPGNVRELAHRVERAVLLAKKNRLGDSDLQLPTSQTRFACGTMVNIPLQDADDLQATPIDSSLDLRSALEGLERKLIDRALQKAGGNRTEAAALLGLNRTTLVEKLRKYAG
jgi:transcriptional regulator with GAF, ATPase, and Fis domain